MTPWIVEIKNSVKPDLRKLQRSYLDARFRSIVDKLTADPYDPSDSFERLQPLSARRFSRRINRQHRVVYTIDDDRRTVTIYSAWTHYE